jgi:hypothetical protein
LDIAFNGDRELTLTRASSAAPFFCRQLAKALFSDLESKSIFAPGREGRRSENIFKTLRSPCRQTLNEWSERHL